MAKKEKKLNECSLTELQAQYEEKTKHLFELKNEYRLNRQLKKPHMLKATKKEIARILTFAEIQRRAARQGDQS